MIHPTIDKSYTTLKRAFYVKDRNLNTDGTLDTCKILKEILAINDLAIFNTYGYLDYSAIKTPHYNLSFSGEGELYDLIELEARYAVVADGTLSIKLFVRKRQHGAGMTIAEGSFIFATGEDKPRETVRL